MDVSNAHQEKIRESEKKYPIEKSQLQMAYTAIVAALNK